MDLLVSNDQVSFQKACIRALLKLRADSAMASWLSGSIRGPPFQGQHLERIDVDDLGAAKVRVRRSPPVPGIDVAVQHVAWPEQPYQEAQAPESTVCSVGQVVDVARR